MHLKLHLLFIGVLCCFFLKTTSSSAQNLIDMSNWTVGSGGNEHFVSYGTSTSENSRVLGKNHLGEHVVLWKASPDDKGGRSGGFTSLQIPIDHTKTYRLSVWIKKTNSKDGSTHFKAHSFSNGTYQTTNLNGSPISWQPFWFGDLPKLNRWYLLVGYMHGSNYNSTISRGRIYDGTTGEVLFTLKDQKFKSSATVLQHRTILYADSNLMDRQFMYDPRIELMDGSEWSIAQLLGVHPNSKLVFSYDAAHNQKQRKYCPNADCNTSGRTKLDDDLVLSKKTTIPEDLPTSFEQNLRLYPNPIKRFLIIHINSKSNVSLAHDVHMYSSSGALVRRVPSGSKKELKIDLKGLATGIYLIHLQLSDGTHTTKQIIKK